MGGEFSPIPTNMVSQNGFDHGDPKTVLTTAISQWTQSASASDARARRPLSCPAFVPRPRWWAWGPHLAIRESGVDFGMEPGAQQTLPPPPKKKRKRGKKKTTNEHLLVPCCSVWHGHPRKSNTTAPWLLLTPLQKVNHFLSTNKSYQSKDPPQSRHIPNSTPPGTLWAQTSKFLRPDHSAFGGSFWDCLAS